MIIIFYDHRFKALQNNTSLNVGTYDLKRKAIDHDEFTAVCEPFLQNCNPCFIVMKNDVGKYHYGCFAGIPELSKDNQTKIQGSDLKTLFNNEVLLKYDNDRKKFYTLKEFFDDIFETFNQQVIQGSFDLEFKTDEINDIAFTLFEPQYKTNVYNMWSDILVPFLKYYDCYIDSYINLVNKKIVYTVKKTNIKKIPFKLWESDITKYGKWIASINEVIGCVKCKEDYYYTDTYILKLDSSITNVVELRDIYPIKKKVIFKEIDDMAEVQKYLADAAVEALTQLVEARFNESFDIKSDINLSFDNVDFSTSVNVYQSQGVFYKTLPIGMIREKDGSKISITFGYKPSDIVYFFK